MGVSKVQKRSGEVIMDITNDTVTADTLLSGITAHNKSGELITGNLVVNIFRSGTSEPSNSLGNNGDWYLVLEG